MASKTSKKSKKLIETTLGQAKTQKSENEIDISNVRKPIETTVSGLRQAIALLDTATEEVKNYVMYECDIMYECKMCRNIFRSLANFILHKRNYCLDKFNPLDYLKNNGAYQEVIYPLPDNSDQNDACSNKVKEKQKKTINPVIDKLLEKHKIEQLCKEVVSENLTDSAKHKPLDKPVKNMEDCEVKFGNRNSLLLEKIDSNNAAVFQTLVRHRSDESFKLNSTDQSGLTVDSTSSYKSEKQYKKKVQEESDKIINDFTKTEKESSTDTAQSRSEATNISMKSQVMEIHGILENDKIVVGSDGKLKGYYKEKASGNIFPKKYLICTECNVRFTTRKTLSFHLRTRHNNTAKIHFCPVCKDLLANPWCVVRHLIKVHRMSNKQVKNLREKIHSSWVIQEDASSMEVKKKSGESSNRDEPTDPENQWINNIEEDNDLQMCAGCGKRFERRAALHSHSVMCAKRIAVCATIKENNAKKREEEDAFEKARQKQALDTLKGASKRKGTIIRRKTDTENVIVPTNISQQDFMEKNRIFAEFSRNKSTENINVSTENSIKSSTSLTEEIKEINLRTNLECQQKLPYNVTETSKGDGSSTALISPTKEICIALPRQKIEDIEKRFKMEQLHEQKVFSIEKNSTNISINVKKLNEYNDITSVYLNDECYKKKICLILKKSLETNESSRQLGYVDKQRSMGGFNTGTDMSSISFKKTEHYASKINPELKTIRRLSRNNKLNDDACSTSLDNKEVQDIENSTNENQSSGLGNSLDMSTGEISFEKSDNIASSKMELNNLNLDKRSKNVISVLKKKRRLSRNSKRNADQNPKRKRNVKKTTLTKRNSKSEKHDMNIVQSDVEISDESFKSKELQSLDLEQGFAGFPQEEISDFRYVIKDLSTLSYNNPLRSLQKLKKEVPRKKDKGSKPNYKKPLKRKNIRKSLNLEAIEKLNINEKREMSFINKASPYMDQERLCCIPCSLNFESFSLLLWHMSAHFSWFRFQCSRCSFISFNKFECVMHAKKQHLLTTESSISSVVLPVPNWKTILMSHEFRLLKDFENLKGKHTDETILLEDSTWSNTIVEEVEDLDTASDDLFADCDKKSVESQIFTTIYSDSDLNAKSSGIIDITEQLEDCQMLKEPDELVVMPPDISEVFDTLKYKEYVPFEERTPISGEVLDESSNDTEFYSEIFKKIESPRDKSPGSRTADIEKERSSTPESSTTIEDVFYNKDSPTLSIRPSRIRTKAKLHEDFVYYDLSNTTIKICDSPKNNNLKSTKVVSSKPVSVLVQKKK